MKCDCRKLQNVDMVKLHLYQKSFRLNYYYWTNHGEEVVVDSLVSCLQEHCQNYCEEIEGVRVNQYETIIIDIARSSFVNDY